MPKKDGVRKRTVVFVLLTFLFSSLFYFLIISTGRMGAGGGLYVLGFMWSPGFAALITCRLCQKDISDLGWRWGKTRYQLWSYGIPLAYTFVAYFIVWLSGLGGFYDEAFVERIATAFGWESMPNALVVILYVLFMGTFGLIRYITYGLGEEIGWRGFLVPELAKITGFSQTALISGLIWSVWHYPVLLFADYNSGTPAWYGLTCFTVMVVGISYPYAWLRLKSGSLWTGAILHGSHNLFIQSVFTPLTYDTGITEYVIDEFGAALAIVSVVVAFIFWKKRSQLEEVSCEMPTDEVSETAAPA